MTLFQGVACGRVSVLEPVCTVSGRMNVGLSCIRSP